MKRTKTFELCLCALFAALTAVCSQIAIPLKPVPINVATFSVFFAGALLGPKLGAISQAVYVLMGAIGLPVFSSFRGGFAALIGPTGGYIVGYILAAWLVGFLAKRGDHKIWVLILAMVAGFFAYMTTGTAWYMFCTKTALVPSLMGCVVPFIPGDAAKMILATVLVRRLHPILDSKLQKSSENTATV